MPESFNNYAYCVQDPINQTDANGNWGIATHKDTIDYMCDNAATNSYIYGTTNTNRDILKLAAEQADTYFHYQGIDIVQRPMYDWEMTIYNNYINDIKYSSESEYQIINGIKQWNRPCVVTGKYHGNNKYDTNLGYIFGLALQIKCGYRDNMVLRNSAAYYKTINFDVLLQGPYYLVEAGMQGSTTSGRPTMKRQALYTFGLLAHLAADIWAHVPIMLSAQNVEHYFASKNLNINDYFADWNTVKLQIDAHQIQFLDLTALRNTVTSKNPHVALADNTAFETERYAQVLLSLAKLCDRFDANKPIFSKSTITVNTNIDPESTHLRPGLGNINCAYRSLTDGYYQCTDSACNTCPNIFCSTKRHPLTNEYYILGVPQ